LREAPKSIDDDFYGQLNQFFIGLEQTNWRVLVNTEVVAILKGQSAEDDTAIHQMITDFIDYIGVVRPNVKPNHEAIDDLRSCLFQTLKKDYKQFKCGLYTLRGIPICFVNSKIQAIEIINRLSVSNIELQCLDWDLIPSFHHKQLEKQENLLVSPLKLKVKLFFKEIRYIFSCPFVHNE
jgi:hypothetical protein